MEPAVGVLVPTTIREAGRWSRAAGWDRQAGGRGLVGGQKFHLSQAGHKDQTCPKVPTGRLDPCNTMRGLAWTVGVLGVLYKTWWLALYCVYKKISFLFDSKGRERDLEKVTASYDLPEEGLKYLEWRNARTVSNFFYTSHMVYDYFDTLMQDLNKEAGLYEPAPNPILHDPHSQEEVRLLTVASKGIPLVINFGSCT